MKIKKCNYKVGDIVLIEYWYKNFITPCVIKKIITNKKFLVSHKNKYSKIFNAPDQIIKYTDIIDYFKGIH